MSTTYMALCKLTPENNVYLILKIICLIIQQRDLWENISLIVLYGNKTLLKAKHYKIINSRF